MAPPTVTADLRAALLERQDRLCAVCGDPMPSTARFDASTCSARCRKALSRARRYGDELLLRLLTSVTDPAGTVKVERHTTSPAECPDCRDDRLLVEKLKHRSVRARCAICWATGGHYVISRLVDLIGGAISEPLCAGCAETLLGIDLRPNVPLGGARERHVPRPR